MSCEVLKVSSYLASLAPRCLKFGQNEGPTSQFCFSAEKKLRLLAPVLGSSKRGSFEHPSGSSSLIFGHLVHVQIRYYHSNNAEIEKHDCSIYILLYKFSWGKLRGTRNSFFSPYSTSSFIPLFQLFPKNGMSKMNLLCSSGTSCCKIAKHDWDRNRWKSNIVFDRKEEFWRQDVLRRGGKVQHSGVYYQNCVHDRPSMTNCGSVSTFNRIFFLHRISSLMVYTEVERVERI